MTPKRITPSIKKDSVKPSDYVQFEHRWSCDECTHFSHDGRSLCTLGYPTAPHRLEQQKKDYNMSGRIAFCRFHEID
jgi:hypothetical protein